jgi:hypothetical protein
MQGSEHGRSLTLENRTFPHHIRSNTPGTKPSKGRQQDRRQRVRPRRRSSARFPMGNNKVVSNKIEAGKFTVRPFLKRFIFRFDPNEQQFVIAEPPAPSFPDEGRCSIKYTDLIPASFKHPEDACNLHDVRIRYMDKSS